MIIVDDRRRGIWEREGCMLVLIMIMLLEGEDMAHRRVLMVDNRRVPMALEREDMHRSNLTDLSHRPFPRFLLQLMEVHKQLCRMEVQRIIILDHRHRHNHHSKAMDRIRGIMRLVSRRLRIILHSSRRLRVLVDSSIRPLGGNLLVVERVGGKSDEI